MIQKQLTLSLKSIVLAKVQDYSPWPARIVRIFKQHGKKVYKVHFFGDPTYCYVHQEALILFQSVDWKQYQNIYSHDCKLQKAIQLAKISYFKNSHKKNNNEPQQVAQKVKEFQSDEQINDIPNQENLQIYVDQRINQPEPSSIVKEVIIQPSRISITPDNVLELLQTYRNGGDGYIENYERKQLICIQNELKQNLLLKYKLNTVDFLNLNEQETKNCKQSNKTKKTIKKDKIKPNSFKLQSKVLCYRSIKKILTHKGISYQLSMQLADLIIKKIQSYSVNQRNQCDSVFQEHLLRVAYYLIRREKQIDIQKLQQFQKQMINLLQITVNDNKIQENSGSTTISSINGSYKFQLFG